MSARSDKCLGEYDYEVRVTGSPNEVVSNAHRGRGPCGGCPARADTGGRFVNPGLVNYGADLVFLAMDPSHYTDWGTYADWTAYNADRGERFKTEWRQSDQEAPRRCPGVFGRRYLARRRSEVSGRERPRGGGRYRRGLLSLFVLPPTRTPRGRSRGRRYDGENSAEQLLDGGYGLGVSPIKAGSGNCGGIYDASPPVVVSPRWANGWLGRNDNRRKARNAVLQVLGRRTPASSSRRDGPDG